MQKMAINLQDTFLNLVRKENVPLTVFLVNGYQLKGMVKGFDNFTLVMEVEGRHQLVYKHAVSTISPARPIQLVLTPPKEEDADVFEPRGILHV
ncbi:MAG: RNA chaperone Hfq [Firmicutes bacterium]|nr:RNA chaperone Hfq [Bacillota bacterium]